MAFSKIDGFEVTPRTPSSCVIRFSSPFVMMLRRMKSSHTDCPYFPSSIRGFVAFAFSITPVGCMLLLLLKSLFRAARAELFLSQDFFCRRDYRIACEPKMFLQVLQRGGRAETMHTDHFPFRPDVARPS